MWLNLIPFFGFVWLFITVTKVSESLKYEYRERGLHRRDETYGYGLGIAMGASVSSRTSGSTLTSPARPTSRVASSRAASRPRCPTMTSR